VIPLYKSGKDDQELSRQLGRIFSDKNYRGDYAIVSSERDAARHIKKYSDFIAGHFYLVCRMDLTIPEIKEQLISESGFKFHDHLITIEESREFFQHASSKPNQPSRAY
jgi:hypothetical protein